MSKEASAKHGQLRLKWNFLQPNISWTRTEWITSLSFHSASTAEKVRRWLVCWTGNALASLSGKNSCAQLGNALLVLPVDELIVNTIFVAELQQLKDISACPPWPQGSSLDAENITENLMILSLHIIFFFFKLFLILLTCAANG